MIMPQLFKMRVTRHCQSRICQQFSLCWVCSLHQRWLSAGTGGVLGCYSRRQPSIGTLCVQHARDSKRRLLDFSWSSLSAPFGFCVLPKFIEDADHLLSKHQILNNVAYVNFPYSFVELPEDGNYWSAQVRTIYIYIYMHSCRWRGRSVQNKLCKRFIQ